MRQIRLVLAYDGTDYAGFQIQPHAPTVQGTVQNALGRLLGETVGIRGASRTDAGVHAHGQVVTFTTEHGIPLERLPRALNDLLPGDISCLQADEATVDFHPQFCAVGKLYRYQILRRQQPCPFRARYSWHIWQALDVAAMQQAAQCLVGEHDFSSFCAAGGCAKSPVRTIRSLQWREEGEMLTAEIAGNGFLYMMVRIIVGTLVEVGLGRWPREAVYDALQQRDRSRAGPTAPPQGLCLIHVEY